MLPQILGRAFHHDVECRALAGRGANRQRAAQQADALGDVGEPKAWSLAVRCPPGRAGGETNTVVGDGQTDFPPSCFSATCTVVAWACFMTLLSASWTMR